MKVNIFINLCTSLRDPDLQSDLPLVPLHEKHTAISAYPVKILGNPEITDQGTRYVTNMWIKGSLCTGSSDFHRISKYVCYLSSTYSVVLTSHPHNNP